jgi:hypothetical protein
MHHFRKAVLFGAFVAGLLPLFPSQAEAVTLDKTSYVTNEPITVTDITGGEGKYIYMTVFNLDNGGDPVSEEGINNNGDPLDVTMVWNIIPGRYSILEMPVAGNDNGLRCSQLANPVTYENCKTYATNEFLFSIVAGAPPSRGDVLLPAAPMPLSL